MTKAFRIAFQRIRRTPYQGFTSFLVASLTLFSATIFFMDAAAAHKILLYFETRPQVNAFYKADFIPPPSDIENLRIQLEATGKLDSFRYVSKEEALLIYKDINKNEPLLLEAVTPQMLPASVEIAAKNPSDLKMLAEQLKLEQGVEDVRFAEDTVKELTTWTRSFRASRIILTASQIFIAFIVILWIVGSRVNSRKEEIFLMQLIGATRGYISSPFVMEGLLYGLVGGFVAWGAAYLVLLYSTPYLSNFILIIPTLYPSLYQMLHILIGELLLGMFVGGLGGFLAVRRFFRS